jgi:serine/threonine protein kinase/tetratricopeptide (TPR) repeat protein
MTAMGSLDHRDDTLDEIVARYLRSVDVDRPPPPNSLMALYPEWANELREFIADQELVETLAAPLRTAVLDRSATGPHPAAADGDDLPVNLEMIGPYQVLEEIGRGGMGVVYKAWDTHLGRTVAVKTVRAPANPGADALVRFRSEAVAVARLQHPNIVQVFGTGAHAGQPYVVLEYVPGGSLARLLTGDPTPPRDAARFVETLARAVDYAHRRGVIHRDLKPANILLNQSENGRRTRPADRLSPSDFEPKITDFGLAKVLDDGTDPLTQSGAVLGTPAYMSPEQAHGRRAEVGPVSDVYSLGVLLYELLTGRPPHVGVTLLDTLRQVMNDRPVSPRRLQPRVPRDLETICLKCLEKEPARRYASAEVLADELRRYLDRRPILARPVGPVGKSIRWCRRQPGLATLIGMLLVSTTLLAVQVWRAEQHAAEARASAEAAEQSARRLTAANELAEKRREEADRHRTHADEQRKSADEQRKLADERYQTAHGVIRDLAVWASEQSLPGFQPLRQELLARAIRYYEDFLLKDRGDDVALRAELADLYFRTAKVTTALGAKADALAKYRKADDLYDALLKADPINHRYLNERAHIRNNCGILHAELGNRKQALASFTEALELYEQVRRADPFNPVHRGSMASVHNNLGTTKSDDGDYNTALSHFHQARGIRALRWKSDPDDIENALNLTDLDANRGLCLARLGRAEESRKSYEEARLAREELARRHPNNLDVQVQLARSYRTLGDQQRRDGKADEAVVSLRKGLDILEPAAVANPRVVQVQAELASCLAALAEVHNRQERLHDALALLDRARGIHARLADRFPENTAHKADLARTHNQTGLVLAARGMRAEARLAFDAARGFWEELTQAMPTHAGFRLEHAAALHNRGLEWARSGEAERGLDLLRKAVGLTKELSENSKLNATYRDALALRYAAMTEIELGRGRAAEVANLVQERTRLQPFDTDRLFSAARDAALAAGLESAPEADRQTCRRLALHLLRSARVFGFADADRIEREKAFDVLRNDQQFEKFLSELRRLRPPG